MLRVIREIKPTWGLGENVPGIVDLALDTVLADLESEGYEVQCFLIPACGVDAPHKRERIAILAHSIDGSGTLRRDGQLQDLGIDVQTRPDNGRRTEGTVEGKRRQDKPGTSGMADGIRTEVHGRVDPDTDKDGLQGRMPEQILETERLFTEYSSRERERERESRGYDGLLRSFLELTPLGKIGHMNPEYLEFLLGFPIGWSELSA